jgi:hypothetical protein
VTEDFGRNCLAARRMLDRGVRLVQVWSAASDGFPRRNWDNDGHNPVAFTAWQAAENPGYCYDVHATGLHQLGIDHQRLTSGYNGIDRRLTDVHGNVIRELI